MSVHLWLRGTHRARRDVEGFTQAQPFGAEAG
jgi:hypothetical protein